MSSRVRQQSLRLHAIVRFDGHGSLDTSERLKSCACWMIVCMCTWRPIHSWLSLERQPSFPFPRFRWFPMISRTTFTNRHFPFLFYFSLKIRWKFGSKTAEASTRRCSNRQDQWAQDRMEHPRMEEATQIWAIRPAPPRHRRPRKHRKRTRHLASVHPRCTRAVRVGVMVRWATMANRTHLFRVQSVRRRWVRQLPHGTWGTLNQLPCPIATFLSTGAITITAMTPP